VSLSRAPSDNVGNPRCEMTTYKIVRFYMNHGKRVVLRGLTLEQAQAHCSHPDTSSTTCTSAAGKRRTRLKGPWFDGYVKEN
jgi:hypothetical protein